jgi:hypothetical protein
MIYLLTRERPNNLASYDFVLSIEVGFSLLWSKVKMSKIKWSKVKMPKKIRKLKTGNVKRKARLENPHPHPHPHTLTLKRNDDDVIRTLFNVDQFVYRDFFMSYIFSFAINTNLIQLELLAFSI